MLCAEGVLCVQQGTHIGGKSVVCGLSVVCVAVIDNSVLELKACDCGSLDAIDNARAEGNLAATVTAAKTRCFTFDLWLLMGSMPMLDSFKTFEQSLHLKHVQSFGTCCNHSPIFSSFSHNSSK